MKLKLFIITCLISMSAFAQNDSTFWNSEMKKIATPTSGPDWININQGILITPKSFFSTEKKALRLGVADDMRLYKTETDELGFSHERYQQYYKGYKVFGGEFILHAKDGKLITANGKMVKYLSKEPSIKISQSVALKNALNFFPADKYAWEIPQLEESYKLILHDDKASYKPTAELLWVHNNEPGDLKDASKYVLCYVFDIFQASLNGMKIFIDAKTGNIIQSYSLSPDCTVTNVETNFYSIQAFSTKAITGSSGLFNLWDDCQPAFIRTQHWNDTNKDFIDYVSSINNEWRTQASAATSHWCVGRAYNYFLSIHGRNGWNNFDAGVYILQDALFCDASTPCIINNPNNASFSNGFISVGNSGTTSTIDDWNTLDILAHEFTHGVTNSSAGLVYSKESGALDESFSDIFGVTCHAWLFGLNANTWLIGYDRKYPNSVSNSLYIRNMSNPNDKNNPDTYLSKTFWVSTATPNDDGNDNWGVHTNSGVQNYMYYLLVSGGSGSNDNGLSFSVGGIGMVSARKIAYRALTLYLTSTSQYADARNAWVHAAVDLFGSCSFEAIQTGKAWEAVGLPPPHDVQSVYYCDTYGGTPYSTTYPYNISLSPNCTMQIIPSSLVEFGAAKIVLNPGFHAQAGSHFRAYASDCRYAAY